MPERLTTYAAGRALGVSASEALRLAKAGAFGPIERNGCGHVLIPPEAVAAYRAEPTPQARPAAAGSAPDPEAGATPPRLVQDASGRPGTPTLTRERPRRAADPFPGAGRVEVTLEAIRGYRSAEDYGPEMLRLRAALKVLLRRFGLRCKGLRFAEAETEEAA